MDISVRTLKDALASVTAPSSDDEDDYRIAASLGGAFLARARSSAPTLLIPLLMVPGTVGRRGGGFSLTPAPSVAFSHDGRRWEQAAATLQCTDLQLVDAFMVLVVDIARRLASEPNETGWATILGWVDEWQELLGRRALMTPEQELGLWGELWIISIASTPDSLISAWRGPDREAVDFLFDGAGLEVKVSRQAHTHHVSQSQVQRPIGMHHAYLVSVWAGLDPVRGVSVSELVDALLLRVSDGPTLLKKIALLGYSPADKGHYSARYFPLDHPQWFRAEDVPRVRAIDPGISQVRYVVALDVDQSLDPERTHDLWLHFCQRAPSLEMVE